MIWNFLANAATLTACLACAAAVMGCVMRGAILFDDAPQRAVRWWLLGLVLLVVPLAWVTTVREARFEKAGTPCGARHERC